MSEEQRNKVVAEAISWMGTPFRHQGRIKGRRGGVDCGQFLCCVFENAGVTGQIVTDQYPMQWMLHRTEEKYLAKILQHTREISQEETQKGDIVLFRVGHTYSHGAILLEPWPGRIIHATNRPTGIGVMYADGKRDPGVMAEMQRYRNHPPKFFSAW